MQPDTIESKTHQLFSKAMRTGLKIEHELDVEWGMKVDIDEVAILFPGDSSLQQFAAIIHRDLGWHVFNTADSGAVTEMGANGSGEPLESYEAHYVFMSSQLAPDVRLELMVIRSGFSSIHTPLIDKNNFEPAVVHASWKCPSIEAYMSSLRRLSDKRIPCSREYMSDYGRFSYWGKDAPHFKPRVNLRDQPKHG